LNVARPAAQYIAVGKLAPKLTVLAGLRTWYPVTNVAAVPVVVCWGWTVYPAGITVIVWVLLCPAAKPIKSSPEADGVTGPELALALVFVFEDPADTSSGFVAAMPANS
jgi:hypothetical protein